MDGKILIRWLKVICVVALFGVILFYQGQSSPGCPGGGSTPPGCNPGGGGGGGSSTPTDCAKIDKQEDCNNKPDCGWYQPPQGQQATPQKTNNPPICTTDEYKTNETKCKELLTAGCIYDSTAKQCKTWKTYCEGIKATKRDECEKEKYDSTNFICKWDESAGKCQAIPSDKVPKAAPLPSGQTAQCMKVEAYCANIPHDDCNDEKTNKKCEWFEGQCKPKSTQQLCGSKQGNDCNNTPGCILDGNSCITIEAFCEQASGTGEGKGEEACGKKMKNGEKVCEWVGGENKCKPKKGATRTNCSWGGVIKPELNNPNDQCPQGLQCPCAPCFQVTQGQAPQQNNRAKGYGFVKYDGSKIGILCCNGLYKNDSMDHPGSSTDSQIDTYHIVDPFSSGLNKATNLDEASKYCKRIWNGFNVEIQANLPSGSLETSYIGSNKLNRCDKENKNAVRCIDVKRKINKDGKQNQDITTRHIFCCEKDQYLNTYLIKMNASGTTPKDADQLSKAEAVKLPYVHWDTVNGKAQKKLWKDGKTEGQDYKGITSIKDIAGEISTNYKNVCESCDIRLKDSGEVNENEEAKRRIIEKIYNYFYDALGIKDIESMSSPDNLLSVQKKGLFQYFFGVDDDQQLRKTLREKFAGMVSCKAAGTGVTEIEHFMCCWYDGKQAGELKCIGEEPCKNCRKKVKEAIFKRIKDKLEAICKNIQSAPKDCENKDEVGCKNNLQCEYTGGKCQPAKLPKDINIKIQDIENNVPVNEDFFSSQRCGTDE